MDRGPTSVEAEAHDLGHFLLDGHVEELLSNGSGQSVSLGGNFRDQRSKAEREVDVFASELLMPRDLLPAQLLGDASLDSVRRLAALCATSLSSAAIRAVELADHPVAAVLSHGGTIEWYACSPALRGHPWARQGLKGEWIPPESATRRVVCSGSGGEGEIQDEASLLLCEWFPGAPAMCRVSEDCLGMGTYGRVLTMLRPFDLPDAEEFEEERQREFDRSREADWRDPIRGWSWD